MATAAAATTVEPKAFRRRVRAMIDAALGDAVEAVILFGSRARGDATDDSDWDVLVVVRETSDEPSAWQKLRRLRGELMVATNEAVDFVVLKWSSANQQAPLLLNVLDDGQRL